MPNQNTKKEYFPELCTTTAFFVPHEDSNHLNAQDVVCSMVSSAKNISIATYNCFEDGKELAIKGEIVAELIFELQTKLEMIEKILPMAFEWEANKKAVSL